MTRILTHQDLIALLDPDACIEALRDGFTRSDAVAVPGSASAPTCRSRAPPPR